jgi:regulator of RNase E activity RraA
MVGHAVTARIACSSPPPHGHVYIERTAWWDHILGVPAPRVVVIQDIDGHQRGLGALIGRLHADILCALGVVGLVTDGAVRDLDHMQDLAAGPDGFQVFSSHVTPSHAYAHLVSIGGPVAIDGMTIAHGDLLHGDRHGVVVVPPAIAADIPAAVARRHLHELSVSQLCRSADFSPRELRDLLAREHPDLPLGVGELRP